MILDKLDFSTNNILEKTETALGIRSFNVKAKSIQNVMKMPRNVKHKNCISGSALGIAGETTSTAGAVEIVPPYPAEFAPRSHPVR